MPIYTKGCDTDGIQRFCEVAVNQIIWFNQKILQEKYSGDKYVGSFVKKMCRRLVRYLAYTDDSTSWQSHTSNVHWRGKLTQESASVEDFREFVKEHSFPRLVRALHVLLYNDTRLHGAPWTVMTHPRAAERLHLGYIETVLYLSTTQYERIRSELQLSDLVKKCLYKCVLEISHTSGNMRESLKEKFRPEYIPPFSFEIVLGRNFGVVGQESIDKIKDFEPRRWDGLFSTTKHHGNDGRAKKVGKKKKKKKKKTMKQKRRH